MKRIIDIDEDYFEIIKHDVNTDGSDYKPFVLIANSIPYEEIPGGDLISREALKEDIDFQYICKCCHNVNGNVCDICAISEIEKKIDNAPTVEPRDNFDSGYIKGLADAKSDIITLIANEYTSHGELVPNWLTIGETKVFDRQKKGDADMRGENANG